MGKTPKTYADMVKAAIIGLADAKGSSRQAIAKYIKNEFGKDDKAALQRALKKLVVSKTLVQDKQSFQVAGMVFEAAAEEAVQMEDTKVGSGTEAVVGSTVTVKYVGTLQDGGAQFDKASKFEFLLGAGEVIKGWDQGVQGMKVGGRRRLTVPPKLGYGKRGSGPEIPPDSTLLFDITLKHVE